MNVEQRDQSASDPQDTPNRVFQTEEEIAAYLAANPGCRCVRINVVGSPDAPRIMVTPGAVAARQYLDRVEWHEGANCGEWEVSFKSSSPLLPSGPFRSSGTRGGEGLGSPGIYRYSVRARDLRTGQMVEEDPDVVMIPGKRF